MTSQDGAPERTRRRWPLRLLFAVLVAAVTGEAAVRLAEWSTGKSWALDLSQEIEGGEAAGQLYQPHPYIGYMARPNAQRENSQESVHVNSLGFRGPEFEEVKPAGTFRIACLGGSTTWCTGASRDETTWPAVLQRELTAALRPDGPFRRVEVVNAGVPGYTIMESFVDLKMRVMPLAPDLVIVYHAVNDARVIGRGNFRPDYTHVRHPWKIPLPSAADVMLGWSHLYGLVRGRTGDRLDLFDVLYVSDFETMPPRERSRRGVETYARTLTELVAVARVSGADVVLTTFGYTRGLPIHNEWMAHYGLQLIDDLNALSADVAQRQAATLVRTAERLAGDPRLFVDTVHLNDEGNRVFGVHLAQVLREAGFLDGPVAPRVTQPLQR